MIYKLGPEGDGTGQENIYDRCSIRENGVCRVEEGSALGWREADMC